MTVLNVVIFIVFVSSVIYGIFKLNAYCKQTYNYEPINMANILLGFIPLAIIVAGIVGENNGEPNSLFIGIFFAIIASIVIYYHVAEKTTLLIAIVTLVVSISLNILIILLATALEMGRNKQCDDDDPW